MRIKGILIIKIRDMKHKLNKIHTIQELEPHYTKFFFDIWGVILNENDETVEPVRNIINHLINKEKIVFVSNSPDNSKTVANWLTRKGIELTNSDIVVTAGQVTYDFLNNLAHTKKITTFKNNIDLPIKAYVLDVNNHTKWLYNEKIITHVDRLNQADCIIINVHVGNNADKASLLEKIDKLLHEAINLNLPAICLNPDKHFLSTNYNIFYCPGYFANKYKKMKGEVLFIGKPYESIFLYALNKANLDSKKDKILMVGDTLATDVKGAKNVGIDAALVVTGNVNQGIMGEPLKKRAYEVLAAVQLDCQIQNIFPDYCVIVE